MTQFRHSSFARRFAVSRDRAHR